MFNALKSLFQKSSNRVSSGNNLETEKNETKKCKRCLRRINIDRPRCNFCGCSEFHDF